MKFNLDKSFVTVSEQTARTLLVGELFGIGSDVTREFPVLNNVQVDIRPGDVVLITGDSGGGKSTLLKILAEQISNYPVFGKIGDLNKMEIPEDEILIEGGGDSFEKALKNLSLAGLNDAFLMIRKYKELSDGQRYRYRICKMLSKEDVGVWICDEFLSTIDRDTAKVVGFCLQKQARRTRKTVIVATTHQDLVEDLRPSVVITKGFGEEFRAEYKTMTRDVGECSLSKDVIFREGSREDYAKLHQFHYRADLPNNTYRIFTLELNGGPIGCISYGTAPLASAGRHAFMGYHVLPEQLNKEFINISRVVLHPKFRSIGLGARLVRESLPLVSKKYVETTAVMAKYNPFFGKAGMMRISIESDSANEYKSQIVDVEKLGVSLTNLPEINSLPEDHYQRICEYLSNNENYFSITALYGHDTKVDRSKVMEDLIQNRQFVIDTISRISILSQEKAYFVWRNLAIQ